MAASTVPVDGSLYKVEVSTDGGSSWSMLGYQKEANISISTEFREITSKSQCNYREKIPTVSNWTASGTAEVLNDTGSGLTVVNIFETLRTSAQIRIHPIDCSGTPVVGEMSYAGSGFFSQLDVAFPEKETATFSYTFEGSGTLTVTAVV